MKFQTIFLTVFGLIAVVAVGVMSAMPAKPDAKLASDIKGNVVIWGTFPSENLGGVLKNFNNTYKDIFSISYVYHDAKRFDTDIVEALASGKGPDILLLRDDLVLRHSDKIELVPYAAFPPATFLASYVQAAEIYQRDGGLVALPFAIDPMVLYWNRDLFANASLTAPPRYWDELLTITPKLTKFDPKNFSLTQSALPFGEYVNVENAKSILAALFLQVGSPVVSVRAGKPEANLIMQDPGGALVPSEDVVSAFRYYMDFSNPKKANYTWSRSRGNSFEEFMNGNLAMYFGPASDYGRIKEKNPHLNFGVTQVPNPRGTKAEITSTRIYGLAVLKASKNKPTAFYAAQHLLQDPAPARDFSAVFNLPPVIRKYLANKPTDAAMSVFYDAAIRGRAWLDPRPGESDKAFQKMIESVSSGRNDVYAAVFDLSTDLTSSLRPYQ